LTNFFDEDNLSCLNEDGLSFSMQYLRKAGGTKALMEALRTDSKTGIKIG